VTLHHHCHINWIRNGIVPSRDASVWQYFVTEFMLLRQTPLMFQEAANDYVVQLVFCILTAINVSLVTILISIT